MVPLHGDLGGTAEVGRPSLADGCDPVPEDPDEPTRHRFSAADNLATFDDFAHSPAPGLQGRDLLSRIRHPGGPVDQSLRGEA